MNYKTVFTTAAALTLSTVVMGQDKTDQKTPEIKPLTIGDPARPIDISDWLKGDKVAKFENGKVYVLEFWATWCGPCKMSMPHITKLQEQYKDYGVTFIGVSDEDVKTVKDFLPQTDKKSGKTWNETIGYTLTTDPDKSVYFDYFKAAGQSGIPTAFIIGKDGKIEWIGHPMGIDEPLEAVTKDKWDRNAFKTKWEKENAAERDMNSFMKLLVKDGNTAEAYKLADKLMTEAWDSPQMLNAIAWTIVDNDAVKDRNYDIAMKAAKQAVELTENKDGAILDTLAHVYAAKGDFTNAVKYEKLAISVAPDQMKEDLQGALDEFQGKLNKK